MPAQKKTGHQGGKTSAASINKYMSGAYDRINIVVPKGQRETLKAHAAMYYGGSVNALFRAAVAAQIARDEQTPPAATPDASEPD